MPISNPLSPNASRVSIPFWHSQDWADVDWLSVASKELSWNGGINILVEIFRGSGCEVEDPERSSHDGVSGAPVAKTAQSITNRTKGNGLQGLRNIPSLCLPDLLIVRQCRCQANLLVTRQLVETIVRTMVGLSSAKGLLLIWGVEVYMITMGGLHGRWTHTLRQQAYTRTSLGRIKPR